MTLTPSPISIPSSSNVLPKNTPPLLINEISIAQSSPAGMADICSGGKWLATPHLLYINDRIIECVSDPDGGRLQIQAPIRHGKSELVSTWTPPWFLGEFPDSSLIWLSYNAEVAANYGGQARNVFELCAPRIWGLGIAKDTKAKRSWKVAGHAGAYFSTSMSGGLGSRNAHGIIIDDPFKNAQEAESKIERDRVWDAFRNTIYGRLEPQGWMIIMSARWHHEDLLGMIQRLSKGDDMVGAARDFWELVDLPAIALPGDQLGRQVGEALWPERYSLARLEKTRLTMSPRVFSAQIQCRPQDVSSTYFPGPFRYYSFKNGFFILDDTKEVIRFDECDKYSLNDLASTEGGGDWFVIKVVARRRTDGMIFILDIYRAQIAGPKHVGAAMSVYKKWTPSKMYVESTGMQKMKVQDMQLTGMPIISFNPARYGDKLSRADIASMRYKAGLVIHPSGWAPWLADFESELTQYPSGTKDQVDTVSMACIVGAEIGTNQEVEMIYQESER